MRKQGIILEYKSDFSFLWGQTFCGALNQFLFNINFAGIAMFKTSYNAQCGSFTTTAGAEQGENLIFFYFQADIINYRPTLVESFSEPCNFKQRIFHIILTQIPTYLD